MYQYAKMQYIQVKTLINALRLTFYSYNLTMLGKVRLRRNDFLSFQTERDAKASIKDK